MLLHSLLADVQPAAAHLACMDDLVVLLFIAFRLHADLLHGHLPLKEEGLGSQYFGNAVQLVQLRGSAARGESQPCCEGACPGTDSECMQLG
jgi:hypothetical protein